MPKTYYKIEKEKLLELIIDKLKFEALKKEGLDESIRCLRALTNYLNDANEFSYIDYAGKILRNCYREEKLDA